MEPLVSVIIPVNNVLPYLCEALDSVLGQTYRNLEILIIDDGSNDGSETVCDEYAEKDKRITVIHQENRGLSTARNVGLNRMTGDYVAFLDPDDAFHPDMIHRLMEALQRNDTEIAVCGIINCYTLHRMKGKRGSNRQEEIFEKSMALAALTEGRIACCVWNKLYSAELWNDVRFPDGHVYEDMYTVTCIFGMAERVVMVPGCPVRHRIRPGSITQTYSAQNMHDWLCARKQMEDFVEQNTPEIFAPGMLRLVQNQTIRGMVTMWTKAVKRAPEYADTLRYKILGKGQNLDLGTWDLRTRAAYQMLRFCPQMIPVLFSRCRILEKNLPNSPIGSCQKQACRTGFLM